MLRTPLSALLILTLAAVGSGVGAATADVPPPAHRPVCAIVDPGASVAPRLGSGAAARGCLRSTARYDLSERLGALDDEAGDVDAADVALDF